MKLFNYNKKTVEKTEKQSGFAMLFAVLVSSVLLSIGLSIFNLTVKELILSSSGRESQFSFYAADTGAECALYWDFKGSYVFATSSDSGALTQSNPDCAGQSFDVRSLDVNSNGHVSWNSSSAVTTFYLNIPATETKFCSIVTVSKSDNGGIISTTIDSRGYNTPCIVTTDPNRVERALKVTY